MTNFKKLIKEKFLANKPAAKTLTEGVYDIEFKYARLSVKPRKLLDEKTVPVGLFAVLYNNLLRCRIRHINALKNCCKKNIFRDLKWYKCGRAFSRMALLYLFTVPWVLRLWVYFTLEEDTVLQKRELAGRFGLKTRYSGSLTLSLTPLHALFLMIYTILVVDCLVYSCITKALKEKFKFVLRKSLRDIKEQFSMEVSEEVTKFVVSPCEYYGLLGALVSLLYLGLLVACLPALAIYLFPTLNLTVRLLVHLVCFICPTKVRQTTPFEQSSLV